LPAVGGRRRVYPDAPHGTSSLVASEAQRAAEEKSPRERGQAVSLTVPAKPDYVILARLALSAVCRLTPLGPEEVADLKLAITEAAGDLLLDDCPADEPHARLSVRFELDDEKLVLELHDSAERQTRGEELELSRAILAATVDDRQYGEGRIRLVKYLASEAS
jgi:Histidine kinase-like ATPase domain